VRSNLFNPLTLAVAFHHRAAVPSKVPKKRRT